MNIPKRNSKLMDLGEWLGAEPADFIQIRSFVNDLEGMPSPQATKFLESLDLVHKVFKTILRK